METLNRFRRALRAFTLVELLVVIGIIAILIGLLLPVLAGVAARGRDIQCQANLRSIIQAFNGYAAENEGSMPWGFVWNRMTSVDMDEAPENIPGEYVSWATLVGAYMDRGRSVVANSNSAHEHFSAVFQCPEAMQGRPHLVSYAANWAVCSPPPWEDPGPQPLHLGSRRTTMRQNQLLKETAVLWDTAVFQEWDMLPHLRIGCDVDNQRQSYAGCETPQFGYYTDKDTFAQFPPGLYGQNRPVLMRVGPVELKNIDPGISPSTQYPYQGNLRFRHRKNMTCNAALGDGSVRQFTAKMNPDKTIKQHNAVRRYFMMKWPPGVKPDPMQPH